MKLTNGDKKALLLLFVGILLFISYQMGKAEGIRWSNLTPEQRAAEIEYEEYLDATRESSDNIRNGSFGSF